METTYPLSLALFDFVPNIAFLVGAYYLTRLAWIARGRMCGTLTLAGVTLVFLGGFLQATWKLLFVTNTADIRLMSEVQFIFLAAGFFLVLFAVIVIARKSGKPDSPTFLAMAPWKIPFLIVTTLTSLAAFGLLSLIAFRRKVILAGIAFLITFLCLLVMGGLASAEQTIPQQWIEEGFNSTAQIAFALGSFLLYRDYKSHGC